MPERSSAVLRFVAALVALVPWSFLRGAGAVVGALAGSVLRIRREQVEAAMARAGIDPAPAARAMYASLGTALMEFLWMAGRRGRSLSERVRLTPRASAELERHRGTGVVIATAHTGNWDLVGCAAARTLLPLAVVTKHLRAGSLDRFWQSERRAQGIELLDGVGFLRRAKGALASGQSVAVLVDQAPERRSNVMWVEFLGAPALCDRTAALLAARSGAPLLLTLGRRLDDGTHLIDVPLVLEPPRGASRVWVDEATESLQRTLERFVRTHPAQWLWLHRRWKGPSIRPSRTVAPATLPAELAAGPLVSLDEGS